MFSADLAIIIYHTCQISTADNIILLFNDSMLFFHDIIKVLLINLIIFFCKRKIIIKRLSCLIRKLLMPAATILLLFILLISTSTPAFCFSHDVLTDFAGVFVKTLRSQLSINQSYLIPYAAAAAVMLVIIILLLRSLLKVIKNSKTNDSFKEQKRAWLRLPVNQYFLFARDNDNDYEEAKAVNISGGGLLFTTRRKLEQNENLKIILNFAGDKKLALAGQVAWIADNTTENSEMIYLVGVRFGDIKASERDGLISRILQKQPMITSDKRQKATASCPSCGIPLAQESENESRSLCPGCSTPE
jgi:Tfp pilus assembly protein PilZ